MISDMDGWINAIDTPPMLNIHPRIFVCLLRKYPNYLPVSFINDLHYSKSGISIEEVYTREQTMKMLYEDDIGIKYPEVILEHFKIRTADINNFINMTNKKIAEKSKEEMRHSSAFEEQISAKEQIIADLQEELDKFRQKECIPAADDSHTAAKEEIEMLKAQIADLGGDPPTAKRWRENMIAVCSQLVTIMQGNKKDWRETEFIDEIAKRCPAYLTEAEKIAWKALPSDFKHGNGRPAKQSKKL